MVRPLSFSLRTAESRLASANFGGHRFKFGDEWGVLFGDERGFWFCALSAGITLTGSKCPLISLDKFLDTVDVVLVNSPMLARPSNPSPFPPITSLQAQHYHGITAAVYPFYFQQLPHSFYSHGGGTPSPVQRPERIVSVVSVLRSQCLCVALFPSLFSCTYKSIVGNSFAFTSIQNPGCPPNPAIFSMRQLSDTILWLCLRRQRAMAQPDRPVGSQSNHERCNRHA
jgi:hypothetical protein